MPNHGGAPQVTADRTSITSSDNEADGSASVVLVANSFATPVAGRAVVGVLGAVWKVNADGYLYFASGNSLAASMTMLVPHEFSVSIETTELTRGDFADYESLPPVGVELIQKIDTDLV